METTGPVSLAEWAGQWQLPPVVLNEAAAVALATVEDLDNRAYRAAVVCGCRQCVETAARTAAWASNMLADS